MKPNDENGKLPTAERPFRVLIISSSGRRQYNGSVARIVNQVLSIP